MDAAEMRRRFGGAPVARLSTIRRDGRPHVVPVCFAVEDDVIVSVVDDKPKRTNHLRRIDNVRVHPAVSMIADHYSDDWCELWWVRADGRCAVVGDGAGHSHAIDLLAAKYAQYRARRPSGPVLQIDVTGWHAWSAS